MTFPNQINGIRFRIGVCRSISRLADGWTATSSTPIDRARKVISLKQWNCLRIFIARGEKMVGIWRRRKCKLMDLIWFKSTSLPFSLIALICAFHPGHRVCRQPRPLRCKSQPTRELNLRPHFLFDWRKHTIKRSIHYEYYANWQDQASLWKIHLMNYIIGCKFLWQFPLHISFSLSLPLIFHLMLTRLILMAN